MGELDLRDCEIDVSLMQDGIITEGGLGNLIYNDFTNYPKTLYDEKDFDKQKPLELLGRKRDAENSSSSDK